MGSRILLHDKLYITGVSVSIVSFLLPSMALKMGGNYYSIYFIKTFGGQVVFANFILFSIVIQGFIYWRIKKWNNWIGVVSGLYLISFTGNQLYKCYIRFFTNRPASLVDKLNPECVPLAGVWLLLAAGILLLVLSAINIADRSFLRNKKMNLIQPEQ
jgi:hypothetical protein